MAWIDFKNMDPKSLVIDCQKCARYLTSNSSQKARKTGEKKGIDIFGKTIAEEKI